MRVSDLYRKKRFPVVTVLLTAFCTVLSVAAWVVQECFELLCLKTRPEHLWQLFSGCFVHGIGPRWVMWLHLGMNLAGLIPMGILLEKQYGSGKVFLLTLAEVIVTGALFQIVTWNDPGRACGISSVVYAFAVPALCCIFRTARATGKTCLRQPLLWYFILEGFGLLSLLNPMTGGVSLALHGSGVLVGVIFALCNRTIAICPGE